jgi:hypothetical protein
MDEATYQRLEAKIHAACLRAIQVMGPDIKNLSWFGRNAKRLPDFVGIEGSSERVTPKNVLSAKAA